MEEDENELLQLSVDVQLSPVDENYFYFQPSIKIPTEISARLIRQSYTIFVVELRTGIKSEDLPKIKNYFLGLCEDIITNRLWGISFIINGQHHLVENQGLAYIRELLDTTFRISLEDDYAKTLMKTRHAVQNISKKLYQSKLTMIFFFSHIEIDHSLGVKKRSYIDYLNEHADKCRDEVWHLSEYVKKLTDQCKTYIVSYDKKGEEDTNYSLCDTDLMNQILMWVGGAGGSGTLSRNNSYAQLNEAFESVSAMMMFQMYTLIMMVPIRKEYVQEMERVEKYITLSNTNFDEFKGQSFYIKRQILDMAALEQLGLIMIGQQYKNNLQKKFGPLKVKTNVNYCELEHDRLICSKAKVCSIEIDIICRTISQKIVSYKRRYEGGKSYVDMEFDRELFLEMRDKLELYYDRSKDIFNEIKQRQLKGKAQFEAYEAYNELKRKIDGTREVLVDILKKQIGGSQIGKLSQVISLGAIKRSLKVKLLRRINANPFLLDQVYSAVNEIVDSGTIDFPQLLVDSGDLRYNLGNCVISDFNFVKAMCEYDALGVAFQIERPMSAIADPGRIRIRQVSPSLMRVSSFFQKFLYKIEFTPEVVELTLQRCRNCSGKYCSYRGKCKYSCGTVLDAKVLDYTAEIKKKHALNRWNENVSDNDFNPDKMTVREKADKEMREVDYLRHKGDLQRHNYEERWDYTNRVDETTTVLGFMPLFLTEQHWRVAKQLMKPCLAFTATGEPLGYLFAQYQTIPFMLMSSIIKTCKEMQYELQQLYTKTASIKTEQELYEAEAVINLKKARLVRMGHLLAAIELTCKSIMTELSAERFQLPLSGVVKQRYLDYKEPINRTVDVISNNSAFLGQIYIEFKYDFANKPTEKEFDNFLVRLIEQQLRRQTDGWNEQQTQQAFLNKILNLDAVKIRGQQKKLVTVVSEQDYGEKFRMASEGQQVSNGMVHFQRQELQLMMRKQGKFNDNQRMLLIEYKRLYETRVLWMWYVRFLLFGAMDRIAIHKWKCLGITNSYMLFTLIIQNKKQRKNYKRREAIDAGEYADPFDYYQARAYLEDQFSTLYNKILQDTVRDVEAKFADDAVEVFITTQDLEQAAGVLLKPHGLLVRIYDRLRYDFVPLFPQKMQMLVHGEYKGVRMFHGWKPSRKRMTRIRAGHMVDFMRYQYMF